MGGPNGLVGVGLDGFVAFSTVLAIIIGVMFWVMSRKQRQRRVSYLAQFGPAELRMNPQKIGLVYCVLSGDESEVTVVPVWDATRPLKHESPRTMPQSALIPFDPERFF